MFGRAAALAARRLFWGIAHDKLLGSMPKLGGIVAVYGISPAAASLRRCRAAVLPCTRIFDGNSRADVPCFYRERCSCARR